MDGLRVVRTDGVTVAPRFPPPSFSETLSETNLWKKHVLRTTCARAQKTGNARKAKKDLEWGEAGKEGHASFKKLSFPLDKTSVVRDSELRRQVEQLSQFSLPSLSTVRLLPTKRVEALSARERERVAVWRASRTEQSGAFWTP